mgnify:CR=1 FL=1
MGIFDKPSPEEIANKQAQAEAKEAAKQHQRWLSSPVGQAATAKERGDGFFEIELEVGQHSGSVSFGMTAQGSYRRQGFTGLLSDIEAQGWQLEHVGYYFMPTSETSRDKFMSTGQNVAISGKSMGVYLFRNADDN